MYYFSQKLKKIIVENAKIIRKTKILIIGITKNTTQVQRKKNKTPVDIKKKK